MRAIDRRPGVALRGLIVLLVAAPLLNGCLQGEGPVVTEQREARPFTRLEAGSGIRVVLVIGPAGPLEVAAQANILDAIATDVTGDTLHVEATDDFTISAPVTVTVTTPELVGLDLSGGAEAQLGGLEDANLDISLRGGGRLTASGTAGDITLSLDGGSKADLAELAASRINVVLAGGAEATVYARDLVEGSASGGAHLLVQGDPSIRVTTSGGAEVTAG